MQQGDIGGREIGGQSFFPFELLLGISSHLEGWIFILIFAILLREFRVGLCC